MQRPKRVRQTPRDVDLAMDLVQGATISEAAQKHGVSVSTVERIRASGWYAKLEADVLAEAVQAATRVLKSRAASVAKRLVTIALDTNGDTRLRETARKACLDSLAAAGVDLMMGKRTEPEPNGQHGVLVVPAPMTVDDWIERHANRRPEVPD